MGFVFAMKSFVSPIFRQPCLCCFPSQKMGWIFLGGNMLGCVAPFSGDDHPRNRHGEAFPRQARVRFKTRKPLVIHQNTQHGGIYGHLLKMVSSILSHSLEYHIKLPRKHPHGGFAFRFFCIPTLLQEFRYFPGSILMSLGMDTDGKIIWKISGKIIQNPPM